MDRQADYLVGALVYEHACLPDAQAECISLELQRIRRSIEWSGLTLMRQNIFARHGTDVSVLVDE
ncbi:hypothetical protein PHLCEN_2v9594 [Hermanssonia centrifuga]|uniref:Uncharacterized protein n=1 Tax=Hermanssonia centrifuga TaxID=98765 RepID=A0A2R6NQ88_9APHY|nr:hypothetical protein PHLCEN_2v9594 [Hermanssonia centrifuga]